MSSNETPLGTSNKALEIIKNSSGNLARYPDGSSQELRKAIANFHNIDIDNIICGNGERSYISYNPAEASGEEYGVIRLLRVQ